MSYTKVSIPRDSDGAGAPVARSCDIYVIDVTDITSEPTRELGNVNLSGDLELTDGVTVPVIYGTPSTIEDTEEYSGDADARGVKQGFKFDHPGNSAAIAGFVEAFLNRGVVILATECDGTSAGTVHYYGNKCNPLFLTPERTGNSEGNKRTLTFAQEMPGKFLPGIYTGTMPTAADETTTSTESA